MARATIADARLCIFGWGGGGIRGFGDWEMREMCNTSMYISGKGMGDSPMPEYEVWGWFYSKDTKVMRKILF